jgi:hypothetical protein
MERRREKEKKRKREEEKKRRREEKMVMRREKEMERRIAFKGYSPVHTALSLPESIEGHLAGLHQMKSN